MGLEWRVKLANTGASSAAGAGLTTAPETTAPEKLKHLNAQPAIEPQPSGFFSQGLPFGQQSACCAAKATPCVMENAIPPASGTLATEKAIKATRMTRILSMSLTSYPYKQPRSSHGPVTTALK